MNAKGRVKKKLARLDKIDNVQVRTGNTLGFIMRVLVNRGFVGLNDQGYYMIPKEEEAESVDNDTTVESDASP